MNNPNHHLDICCICDKAIADCTCDEDLSIEHEDLNEFLDKAEKNVPDPQPEDFEER